MDDFEGVSGEEPAAFKKRLNPAMQRLSSLYEDHGFSLPDSHSKSWYTTKVWGILLDLLITGSEWLEYKPGEVCSVASSHGRNMDRDLETKQAVGRNIDGLVICKNTRCEVGAVEVGKADGGSTGTKVLKDGRKMSKLLKDMADSICSRSSEAPEIKRELRVYGPLISGLRVQFVSLQYLEGRFCHLERERTLTLPLTRDEQSVRADASTEGSYGGHDDHNLSSDEDHSLQSTRSKTVALLLDSLPEQVSDLTLNIAICAGDDKLPVCPYITCTSNPYAIKRLGLHASIFLAPEPVVSRLLDRLQGLRSIAILGGLSLIESADVGSILSSTCPQLDELEIKCDDPDLEDEQIANLIWAETTADTRVTRASSAVAPPAMSEDTEQPPQQQEAFRGFKWRSIKITAPNFGTVSSAAIVKHAATLEKVVLPHRGLDASDLLALFLRAPQLQELVSLHERANKRRDYYFKPSMARGKTVAWVCSETLRVLKISMQPSKAAVITRDAFMSRLGGFHNLKVLHLRNGVRGAVGFTDFTLANGGLGLLKGLTQLEAFEIKNFAHKIDQEELDWMKNHWPSLSNTCLDCDGHEHGCEN